VAELAGARRRRRLSEEHKAKLAKAGLYYRFKLKNYGSNEVENGADLGVLLSPHNLLPPDSERGPYGPRRTG